MKLNNEMTLKNEINQENDKKKINKKIENKSGIKIK
jgi:hypothetical protein